MRGGIWHGISKDAGRRLCRAGEKRMVDYRRSDKPIIATRPRSASRNAEGRDGETQAFVVSAYGLERRAGWTLAGTGARPINLERRARFARFDVL